MNKISHKIYFEDNIVKIYGCINFNNIIEILNICTKKTENLHHINLDLKKLNNSNSCVLLFIVSYIKNAIKNKQTITILNIPPILSELSKVYNLQNIIHKEKIDMFKEK